MAKASTKAAPLGGLLLLLCLMGAAFFQGAAARPLTALQGNSAALQGQAGARQLLQTVPANSVQYNPPLLNTDIGDDNSLFPGNPFGAEFEPAPQCYNVGVNVSSFTECQNKCTKIMDITATMPGTNPCVAVSYVSSNPEGQTLPPVGCCFPKWRKNSLGPVGGRPGVDTYTAKYVRKVATDISLDNLLSAESASLGLFGPDFALAPECYNLGANTGTGNDNATACLSLCDTWNSKSVAEFPDLGLPPCVAASFISSPVGDSFLPVVGCCFPKMATYSLGVVGTKPGVDSYVRQ